MTELEVVTSTLGGLTALITVLGFAAVSRGWVEGSVTVRVVPPWKRHPAEPKALAKLPEREVA